MLSLNLSRNAITDAGITPLVDALKAGAMPKLEQLMLDFNQISDKGARRFALALPTLRATTGLQEIYIQNNAISKAVIETLQVEGAKHAVNVTGDI